MAKDWEWDREAGGRKGAGGGGEGFTVVRGTSYQYSGILRMKEVPMLRWVA